MEKAFDGKLDTFWRSNSCHEKESCWIQWEFVEKTEVRGLSVVYFFF